MTGPVPDPGGTIPDAVAALAPEAQREWFARFADQVAPQRYSTWARFFCDSETHQGLCCASCAADREDGCWDLDGELCCCRAVPLPGRLVTGSGTLAA